MVKFISASDAVPGMVTKVGFRPTIAGDLKMMDAAIFRETWGGLKDIMH